MSGTTSGRELFDEMNSLVKAIADAMEMPPADVVMAFELNLAAVAFDRLPDGQPVVTVTIGERTATVGLTSADAEPGAP